MCEFDVGPCGCVQYPPKSIPLIGGILIVTVDLSLV